jgi:hypothetical protein
MYVHAHPEETMEIRWMEEAREWLVPPVLPVASFVQWRWLTSENHFLYARRERESLSPGCREAVEKDVEKGMALEGGTG